VPVEVLAVPERDVNRARAAAATAVAVLALGVLLAMVALWPRGDIARPGPVAPGVVQGAKIVDV
jgi:hypothetical protein